MRYQLLFVSSLFIATIAFAQKKPLDHSVYDGWQRVASVKLTPDGRYISYQINPQEGDGKLMVHSLKNDRETVIDRGYQVSVSPDGKWAYCLIKPLFSQTREAKIKKTEKDKMPKDSLAFVNLLTGIITKIPQVKSYKTGEDAMSFVAYVTAEQDSLPAKEKKHGKAGKKDKTKGDNLIVLDPQTGRRDTVKAVTEYEFNKNGNLLAVAVKPEKEDSTIKSSVNLYTLPQMSVKVLSSEKAFYSKPVFNDKGDELAFLASSDTTSTGNKHCSLFYYKKGVTNEIIPQDYKRNLIEGWSLNENSNPVFSKNGKNLFVGIAPWRAPKDTTLVDFESARVDVWSYFDYQIQPQQKKNAEKMKKKTYLSVISLDSPSVITPLTTFMWDRISLLDEGNSAWALSQDNTKYFIPSQWESRNTTDVNLVNLKNGSRRNVINSLNSRVQASPDGKYLLWFNLDDSQWYSYNVEKGTQVCLTKRCGVNFYDEENDVPNTPEPYDMVPLWTEGDASVLICDRYDVWKFQPDGKSFVNLTAGEGRKQHYHFRHLRLDNDLTDPEETFLRKKYCAKKGEPVYLSIFDEVTKKNGVATLSADKLNSLKMVCPVDTFSYPEIYKAKDAAVLAYQKGNFSHSNNLYVTDDNWKSGTCLTNTNPQMKDYRWGTVKLVSWKAYDGKPLNGLLYVPDNMDPSKKYPVMIYFYERRSETMYNYIAPAPSRSTVNIAFYCSRGYLVFVPDIVYKTGHPGESAYNCIVSGAEAVCQQFPYADRSRMAIQGQSWGGYQTAYLITRTNLFRAAGAGAPVSNMTSAYGGIRWESGISRMMQYEHEQSRIGKTLWESGGLDLYLENSPVFKADKVETPVLIMHNDADGAVPWYQGIEYYMALRRLGKKVWMLEYNDEAHNLVERRNMKDLTIRLQQFFDYYLKDEPIPAWMKYGVPATRKGEYWGTEIAK